MRSSQIILAVILVVALRGSAAAAQHAQQVPVVEWLQPRPSGNQINSIATHGSRWVAVGDAGTITLSTDAGATWKARGTSTAEALRGVAFLDSLRLLAVGERGVVLESADGGQNWQARSSGTSHELRDVALSGQTAVIIGASGLVQRSANAGKTWRTEKSGVTTVLRGLATPTSNTFVAVGDGGTILRSMDAGVSWRRVASGTRAALRAVLFMDSRFGVAVGGDDRVWHAKRVVLFTRDAGATWSKANAPRGGRLYGLAADAERIVAVGEAGAVIETHDAGVTWSSVPHDGTMWLGAALLPKANSIVALGARGAITQTRNGGKNWTSGLTGVATTIGAVAEPSPGVILLGWGSGILRSEDGGASFVPALAPDFSPDSNPFPFEMEFADERRGLAAVGGGLILRSLDGGKTWSKSKLPNSRPARAVQHVGGTTWVAVQHAAAEGRRSQASATVSYATIYRSTDDGVTWAACSCQAKGPMYGLDFNRDVGMVVGAGGVIVRTVDGGATWARVRQDFTRDYLTDVAVVDAATAIVVGLAGLILRTSDGGATWSRIESGTVHRFRAIEAIGSTVVAVGAQGTMVVSHDAGLTWRALHVPIAADIANISMRSVDQVLVTASPTGAVRVWLRDPYVISVGLPGGSRD